MGLVDFKVYYQTECILKEKRKKTMCDMSTVLPLEIRDVSMDDVNLVAFEVYVYDQEEDKHVFPNDYRIRPGMDLKNVIKPYYEYDGELYTVYEGYYFYEHNIKSLNEKVVDTVNEEILKKSSDLDNFSVKIETIQGMLPEDFNRDLNLHYGRCRDNLVVDADDIKFSEGNNLDFIKKQSVDYMDNFLFIDGKLFCKTFGPVVKKFPFHGDIKVKYEQRIAVNFSPFNSDNNGISGFYCYSMLNFIKKDALFSSDKNLSIKNTIEYDYEKLFDNQVIVYNQDLLDEVTRKYFGLFIFRTFLDGRLMKNAKSHLIRNSHEVEMGTWFKSIRDKYIFGDEIYQNMKNCIDNNYDYDRVLYFIESLKKNLNNFSTRDNYLQDLRKYVSDDLPKVRKNTNSLLPSDMTIVNMMLGHLKLFNNGLYNVYDNNVFNAPDILGCENSFILNKDLSYIFDDYAFKM